MRVVEELESLREKLTKLQAFVDKGQPDSIEDDWHLLVQQRIMMSAYANILSKRIERFSK